jgi:hypothetical protein
LNHPQRSLNKIDENTSIGDFPLPMLENQRLYGIHVKEDGKIIYRYHTKDYLGKRNTEGNTKFLPNLYQRYAPRPVDQYQNQCYLAVKVFPLLLFKEMRHARIKLIFRSNCMNGQISYYLKADNIRLQPLYV